MKTDKVVLAVLSREKKGKAAKALRQTGQLPAVMYGHSFESTSISVDSKAIERAYAKVGGSQLVGLKLDEARSRNALIHDVQRNPRTGALTHVDFYLVRMDEKLKTEVPLHFIGESTAVYQDEGTLVKNLDMVEIEALPGNLPENLEVDISVLDTFDKVIHVSDLAVPEGVEILTDAEEVIARVEPPRSDEELAELDEDVKEELPEGVQEEQVAIKEENEGDKDRQGFKGDQTSPKSE